MNLVTLGPSNRPFKTLWARAPWWRFSLMLGALLTLLVGLFPPTFESTKLPPTVNEASYTPPVASPLPVEQPKLAAISAPPSEPHQTSVQTPAVATPKPVRITKPVPQTADLSLATSAKTSINKESISGLDPALLGRTYRESIMVNGFNLPLPTGNWAMLANSSVKITKDPNNTGMSYFLGRIEHKRLIGGVVIFALRSPPPSSSGFEEFKRCNDPGSTTYIFKEEITPFNRQACWLISTYFTPPWQQWADRAVTLSTITRAAAGDMSAKGVSYSQDLVAVQFYRAEKWGVIDATYLFDPEGEGIKSGIAPTMHDSDWFGPRLQLFPEKIAYINKLKNWGNTFWGGFKMAFSEGEGSVTSSSLVAPRISTAPSPRDLPVNPNQPLKTQTTGRAADLQIVAVKIVNHAKTDASVFWVGSGGSKLYRNLAPGDSYVQRTFPGHRWVAKFSDGPDQAFTASPDSGDWILQ